MTNEKIYSVNIVLAAGFLIISLVLGSERFGFTTAAQWLTYISILILIITAVSQKLAGYIARGWMGFGMFLGTINAKIVLTLLFFLMLVPLAYLKKLTVKKSLQNPDSNWTDVSDEKEVNFEKPW